MNSEKGFTLLEVFVALGVFLSVAGAMAPSFVFHLKQNTQNTWRTGAIAAAQGVLDDLRIQDPSTFPTSGSDPVQEVQIGTRAFQVTTSYCTVSAYCPSTETRHIEVEVEYRGKTLYTVETVFTKLR